MSLRAAAVAALACGPALVVSGLVNLAEPAGAGVWALVALGVVCTIAGVVGLRWAAAPRRPPSGAVLVAACWAWATMIAVSAVAYLAAGATGSVGDAVFESIAGFCTTNLSVLANLEALPPGVLLWRALTQWLGGFGALALLAAALPLHAPLLVLPGDGGSLPERASRPQFAAQLRRLGAVYVTCSALCAAAYAVAGMGPLDAFSYSFTTVSTGGFGNHPGGPAYFESAAVEWVATVFMALAGVSATTLWWALRGRFGVLRRSFELRVYLLVLVGAGAVLAGWIAVGDDGAAPLRRGAGAVAAALSSTGFEPPGWEGWAAGAQILMVALIATGGMAGTAGGGFRLRRAVASARYAYRELVEEVHPSTVHVVKIGHRSVGERPLALLNGYQTLFALAALAGIFGLTLTGWGLWDAASAAVSALATMGPAPGAATGALGGGEQAVLATLMLLGRLAFFPLVVAAGVAVGRARRLWPHAERHNGRRPAP